MKPDMEMTPGRIINKVLTKDGNTYILETNSKLSESFTELPAGIINKSETGIGATTLELLAPRNSIIVEPIKVTASSKSNNFTKNVTSGAVTGFTASGALYVGSPTLLHKKKATRKDIQQYHRQTGYKKICVVADSLYRVLEAIGPEVFQQYFLMVDEADAFQLDSSYRSAMNYCLDHYKKFPGDKRALVTATFLQFSDPELKCGPLTAFKYEHPSTRTIDVLQTTNLKGEVADLIGSIRTDRPGEKILVAYNSPTECYDIAYHLEKNQGIRHGDLSILCSSNSKDVAGKYFKELDSDRLPTPIVFITSAYFSGFDLHEDFHLISVADGASPVYALSEHKLKQIAGRCRQRLLSETVVYNIGLQKDQLYTEQDLISAAEHQLKALECMNNNYVKSSILANHTKQLRSLLIKSSGEVGLDFIRTSFDGKETIAYLNIDARLEMQRTRQELYRTWEQLPERLLEEGHTVNVIQRASSTEVEDQDVSTKNKEQQATEVIEAIQNLGPYESIAGLITSRKWTRTQQLMLTILDENQGLFDIGELLSLVEQGGGKRDNRELNNLRLKLWVASIDPANVYYQRMTYHFRTGQKYSPDEQLVKWNKLFQECGLQYQIQTPVQAARMTEAHFETKRGKGTRKIVGLNPLGLSVLKSRSDDEAESLSQILDRLVADSFPSTPSLTGNT